VSYANIVTLLSGGADDAAALAAAAELVRPEHGVIRAALALPMMAADYAMVADGGYLNATAVDAIEASNAAVRRKTETLVRETGAAAGFELDDASPRIRLLEAQSEASLDLSAELPLCDLVAVGQATLDSAGVWSRLVSDILIRCQSPFMVVRRVPSDISLSAAIAWDGSLAAGRAVRAALPLLLAAPAIYILHDPDAIRSGNAGAANPARLTAYLRSHGAEVVETTRLPGASRAAGLADLTRAHHVGLLVAGAFSHSRLREQIIGGVTGALIEPEHSFNLFLSH
jgi:nucleotide-binding universal stress UspA family protein